jgi:hypothetical protein
LFHKQVFDERGKARESAFDLCSMAGPLKQGFLNTSFVMGPRFDICHFHDAALLAGAMLLAVLDQTF